MIEFLKLHWMLVERLDGTSPLICFGDDGGGGGGAAGGGGGEGGTESSDTGGGQETFEGGANFDSSPSSDAAAVEAGNAAGVDSADFDGSGLEGGTGGTGGGSVEGGGGAAAGAGGAATGDGAGNFESLSSSAPAGYADYGSNIEQGSGAAAAAAAASAGTAAGTVGGTVSDFLSSSQNAPNVPDPTAGFNIAGLAPPPGKEDKEDKPSTPSGLPSIYDLPMGPPNTKELEKEFQKEFQQQFETPPKEQQELPANAMPTGYNAPYGSQQLDINAFVGPSQKEQSQWAPSSTTTGLTPEQVAQSNQWDIGPTTAVNAFGVGLTANPFASTNVWDVAPPPSQAAAKDKEQSPFDQQQSAVNTFGFNPTAPAGYNMPSAISGVPTGSPPAGQQVATGPNAVQTTGFIAPNPTTPVTQGPPLGPAVPTGKSDFISSYNPFAPDKPDVWNPDYFAPPVGMVNLPSTPAPPGWAPQSTTLQDWQSAQPFGPNMPTQASPQVAQGPPAQQGQAPMPTAQQAFNPTQIAQQSPNLFDLPVGTRGPDKPDREARERSPYDMPPGPPPYEPPAPAPSQIIDTSARNSPPWSSVPPPTVNAPAAPPVEVATPTPPQEVTTREPILDPSGNIVSSLAPMSKQGDVPTGQQGNPLAGGIPGGSTVELPSSQQGGGAGAILPAVLTAAQGEIDRRKRRRSPQETRDDITEALMRRDLFGPQFSDFDRSRLQP